MKKNNMGKKAVVTLAAAVAVSTAITPFTPPTTVHAANNMVNTAVQQAEKRFKDITNKHWAYESIYWGVNKGLVVGFEDGTYRPSLQITEQEFATVLARFVTNTDKSKFVKTEGVWWSQPYYDELAKYQLPFKGYNNKVAKETALTRGEIARIIAAKNGFNLTERQAIYYMYENDISYGMIQGTMTFESYGADKAVSRDQIPAFFQRLSEKGHTTFKGKPSNVKGDEMGGIVGIPQDNSQITDKDFDDLAKDKGVTNPTKPPSGTKGSYDNPYGENELSGIAKNENIYVKMNGLTVPYSIGGTGYALEHGLKIKTQLLSDWQQNVGGFRDPKLFVDAIEKWGILDDKQLGEVKTHVSKYHGLKGMDLMEMGLKGRFETTVKGQKYDISISIIGSGTVSVHVYEKGRL